jgi:DNA-3-methyladenine glycosylase
MILPRDYFDRPTLEVARSLVGKYLVREQGSGLIVGRIIEVEAYIGTEDKACHASKGRTARTDVLFGPPGHAYVYLCYGMYEMLNVVTEQEGFPAAILLRAVECDGRLIDGPGRLTRAFGIDRRLNRCDLTLGQSLWFEDRGTAAPAGVLNSHPRIGVEYAGEWAHKPWRFRLTTDLSTSRRPRTRLSASKK